MKTSTISSRLAAAMLLALAVALSVPATAKVKVDKAGAALQPTSRLDFLRHPDDSKYYAESWTTILQSDEGHILYINFMYTNIGVTSGRTAVSVNLSMPGESTARNFGWEYDTDDYQEDFDGGTISIGPHSLTLQGRTAKYRIEAPDMRISFTLRGWTQGVKFHDGKICIDEACDEWVLSYFHLPRGEFEGEMSVKGQRIRLKGQGYLDHMVNNQMSSKWSSHWWTTRYFAPDHTVAFWAFKTRPDRGGEKITRMVITDREKVLAVTESASLKTEQPARDPSPKGHSYDTVYNIDVKRSSLTLAGSFTGKGLHDRDGVLERLPWAQRTIAQAVAGNPVIYRQRGEANLTLTLEGQPPIPLTGTALMEAIVN